MSQAGMLRSLLQNLFISKRQQILCRLCSTEYQSSISLKYVYPDNTNDPLRVPEIKSTYSTEEEEPFSGCIPLEQLDVKYTKSGGAGGQNVNKVNTKVEIRFNVDSASWIPEWIKPRLKEKESGRVSKKGDIIITSEKTRKQSLNKADCLDKIRTMVFQASQKPKEMSEEEKEQIAKGIERANQRRLIDKRYRSSIKKARRDFDD